MNPNLTASFNALQTLQQDIEKQHLDEIGESLRSALPWLEQAFCLMNANRLDAKYSALYVAISDAMNSAQEACNSLEDSPDDTPTAPYGLEALLEAVTDNSEI